MSLSDDFSSFLQSPEAKKPAMLVREDWREWQYEQAVINGDMAADGRLEGSPDDYWEEEEEASQEPSPEELEALDYLTSFSKKKPTAPEA